MDDYILRPATGGWQLAAGYWLTYLGIETYTSNYKPLFSRKQRAVSSQRRAAFSLNRIALFHLESRVILHPQHNFQLLL